VVTPEAIAMHIAIERSLYRSPSLAGYPDRWDGDAHQQIVMSDLDEDGSGPVFMSGALPTATNDGVDRPGEVIDVNHWTVNWAGEAVDDLVRDKETVWQSERDVSRLSDDEPGKSAPCFLHTSETSFKDLGDP
jgi:hypothetical protein